MPSTRREGVKHVPKPETSRRMKAVRQHGTSAELLVRRALTRLGVRYRVNVRSLPGSPDVANVRRKFAIFVHGCFWHRHPSCRYATVPRTNVRFWSTKFEDNSRRDAMKKNLLEQLGIRVVVVWECEARKKTLAENLAAALEGVLDQ
jgi:DNA mismatch endonuclease (patch repair protein)